MNNANSIARFCKKCQAETERYARGQCKPCTKARASASVSASAWRADNAARLKAYGAAWRVANPDKTYRAANPERKKVTDAAWVKANPERIKANNAAWVAANRERKNATGAAWKVANPSKVKASEAAYRVANQEKINAYSAAWYAANTEHIKATTAARVKANPEARRIHYQNHRARKRANGGVLSKGLSAKLFKLQLGLCACCQQPLGDNFQLDHILPIALGGPNVDSNIQLLRKRCNQQKGAKHPDDFMQQRGFLL